jgi:hypothetical protein
LKLKALTEIRDWEQLELFAKKRPSIGYEAFAEHLISTGNSRQSLSYIQRSEGRNRSELYVKAGEWIKAGEGESSVDNSLSSDMADKYINRMSRSWR